MIVNYFVNSVLDSWAFHFLKAVRMDRVVDGMEVEELLLVEVRQFPEDADVFKC